MCVKRVTGENAAEPVEKELPRRLCSEIQLFDLCELESCSHRDERFCTDPEMISRFEAVAEPEDRKQTPCPDDDELDDEPDSRRYDDEEEDDDGYSVFDDEDSLGGDLDDEW